MKKTIVHVIESLGVGGAETLLVNTVNALQGPYTNVVVYLNGPETLATSIYGATLLCLGYSGKLSLPRTILKLRKIITEHNADLVHAHLFWPSIIARLACPANVRLLYSVHSILSEDAFKPNPRSRFLEMITYRTRHEVVFVSEMVKQDYIKHVGLKGKSYVLYNFISDDYYTTKSVSKEYNGGLLRLVAVGNLKEAKNYTYLIKSIGLIKGLQVHLDIFGEGHLRAELQALINSSAPGKITLKGQVSNIPSLLKGYDAFVLSSEHEGFGLAVIEAMASGLPCFLSDLPVFHEITAGHAIFFNIHNEQGFAVKLQESLNNPKLLDKLVSFGIERAQKFNRKTYIEELIAIYKF